MPNNLPRNLTRRYGKQYDARHTTQECAELIKAHIQLENPNVKLTVETEVYKGRDRINMSVLSVPFQVHSDAYIELLRTNDFTVFNKYEDDYDKMYMNMILNKDTNINMYASDPVYTLRGEKFIQEIQMIASEYRCTEEDRKTGYFNANFNIYAGYGKDLCEIVP